MRVLQLRVQMEMEHDMEFQRLGGGKAAIVRKADHLQALLETEMATALRKIYDEAVAEEIALNEYKKGLTYAQRRRLQETSSLCCRVPLCRALVF